MTLAQGNVGVAFAVTVAAGAATMVGSSVVFFPKLVKLASRRMLAGSLGFSAGVMIYISFVDIFQKSVDAFVSNGMDEKSAYGFATLYFFIGIAMLKLVEVLVHRLSGNHSKRHNSDDVQIRWNENAGQCEMKEPSEEEYIEPHCIGCSEDPVGELMKWHENADAEIKAMSDEATRASSSFLISNDFTIIVVSDEETAGMNVAPITEEEQKAQTLLSTTANIVGSAKIAAADGDELDGMKQAKEETFQPPAVFRLSSIEEQKKLVKTGMTTAIAVALHNFPEGLATFVAALHDPASALNKLGIQGVVLAIAIGAHNIPEGLCVSLPIYYATGNRWKAFMWGAISGMAEPVAAIMGWLVLANAVNDMVYAVLFALVSGMMIMISMKELLPTAHRYDPEDSVVT
eukprot:scaffold13468_cov66-Cyclotella_meneghiniana.AAC.2